MAELLRDPSRLVRRCRDRSRDAESHQTIGVVRLIVRVRDHQRRAAGAQPLTGRPHAAVMNDGTDLCRREDTERLYAAMRP